MPRECFFCHEPIDPDDSLTWQATSCFSRSGRNRSGGSKGGADRVVYRYIEEFAHDWCVSKMKAGHLGQESMVV